MNIMQFCEFLTRQRRPKVGIALADNIERVLCKVIWQLVIAEISGYRYLASLIHGSATEGVGTGDQIYSGAVWPSSVVRLRSTTS